MATNSPGLLLPSVSILDKAFIKSLQIKTYKDSNGINFRYHGLSVEVPWTYGHSTRLRIEAIALCEGKNRHRGAKC